MKHEDLVQNAKKGCAMSTQPELGLPEPIYEETVEVDSLTALGEAVTAAGGFLFSFGYSQPKGVWVCQIQWPMPGGKPRDFKLP